MTKRFAYMSLRGVMIAITLAVLSNTTLVASAEAQTQSKTLNLEIKNLPTIPTVHELSEIFSGSKKDESAEIASVEIAAIEVEEVIVIPTPPVHYQIPPKVAPEEKVYMHEPEIRAYLCPIMGQIECNIFVAILKAENGTHECTRDNRGLNKNGSVDVGLAQINWRPGNPWHSFEQLQDCKYNLDVALEMYERRGFQPWYAYTKGAYKKFLN